MFQLLSARNPPEACCRYRMPCVRSAAVTLEGRLPFTRTGKSLFARPVHAAFVQMLITIRIAGEQMETAISCWRYVPRCAASGGAYHVQFCLESDHTLVPSIFCSRKMNGLPAAFHVSHIEHVQRRARLHGVVSYRYARNHPASVRAPSVSKSAGRHRLLLVAVIVDDLIHNTARTQRVMRACLQLLRRACGEPQNTLAVHGAACSPAMTTEGRWTRSARASHTAGCASSAVRARAV